MQKTAKDFKDGTRKTRLNFVIPPTAYLRVQHESERRSRTEGSCSMARCIVELIMQHFPPYPGEVEQAGKMPPRKLAAKAKPRPIKQAKTAKRKLARAAA